MKEIALTIKVRRDADGALQIKYRAGEGVDVPGLIVLALEAAAQIQRNFGEKEKEA